MLLLLIEANLRIIELGNYRIIPKYNKKKGFSIYIE